MTHTIGNIIKDFNLGPKGLTLLNKLHRKELTYADFDKETAYWMLTNITEYHKRPLPTLPEDLAEYNRKKRDDYKFSVHSDFFKQPHIAEYMATASAVECANKSNLFWLRFMDNVIPAEDIDAHKKIREQLNTYGVFSDRKYAPPIVDKAKEIFGVQASCPKDKDGPDNGEWNT